MGTLYIIGNGFDLHFGLKTKTEDFAKNLRNQCLYNEIDDALDILNFYGVDWHEYEQSLNDIDLDEIEFQNEIQPNYLSDRESDRDGGICNMQMYVDGLSEAINTALEQMTAYADYDARKLSAMYGKKTLFQSGDAILTFNYTSTVEYLFFVPDKVPISHIHGCYADGNRLMFGYKSNANSYGPTWPSIDEENWDYYLSEQRQVVYKFYDNWKKQIQVEKLNAFLSDCSNTDRVTVLGHSMSAVDAQYMERIEKALCPKVWKISYYRPEDIEKIKQQSYSFESKMVFATMEELIGR